MRKIVYTRPDGGLSVVTPILDAVYAPTESEAERIAFDRLPSDAIGPRFVAAETIPADRTFRDAWTDAGSVVVDMPKARELHKDTLRRLRAPLLAALDVDYQRADELNDTAAKQDIAARKQALRDVTADPAIEAAKTPEELKAVMPDALQVMTV